MKRAPSFLAGLLALCLFGCGAIHAQNRPHVVSHFPADGQVLAGWVGTIRVVFDVPVRILDEEAVGIEANGEDLEARAFPDPSDPNAIVILPSGGRLIPGADHRVVVHEGVVVNDEDHYLEDQFDFHFTPGPRPTLFVASDDGNVYEIDADTGTPVAATAAPVGLAARDVLGSDDEVFVWLTDAGPGSDRLAWFAPGAATMTTIALAGESGERVALGMAIAADGRTLYATAVDLATNRVRVHRVDTTSRAEIPASIELTAPTPAPYLARRPAIDPTRNRLYVAHGDGSGGGRLSVVDLYAFTEIDAEESAGLSAPLVDGAGDLTYGPITDRIWMTIAEEPQAGLVVINPDGFGTAEAREQEFTQNPVASLLTPEEQWFLQGLDAYTDRQGLVYSQTDDIGQGFSRTVDDDVGGVEQGSTRLAVLVLDIGSSTVVALATGSGKTVLLQYEVVDSDVTQVDLDVVTDGLQGLDLSVSAPGEAVAATFLRGAFGP